MTHEQIRQIIHPSKVSSLLDNLEHEYSKVTLTLRPNIDEYIRAMDEIDFDFMNYEMKVFSDLDLKPFGKREKKLIVISDMCFEHDIIPFKALEYDYSFRPNPAIEYIGPSSEIGYSLKGVESFFDMMDNPITMFRKYWAEIRFSYVEGEQAIATVCKTAQALLEKNYTIVDMYAQSGPRNRYESYETSTRFYYPNKLFISADINRSEIDESLND